MRIRLSSLEPMAINDELIDAISSSQIICPHLHIPLQSGDNDILSKMKRPYSAEDFNALARKLLERIPGLCLGLDVIVGFPGESEENFAHTRDLLESLPFGYLHIFTFSPRANTPAKKLRPKVTERISQERARILAALNQNRRREFALSQVGRKMEMIVEGREDDWAFGHSGNYLYLKARTRAALRKRVAVELKEVADNLIAEEV
jgi:threonylcarbamoyladenosine tRNA methylthiotransferase MtaB